MNQTSAVLVNQRIRNRVIEVLEVIASADSQGMLEPAAILNMWEDWVDDKSLSEYVEPVFTAEEQVAIAEFHGAWNRFCDATPNQLPPLELLVKNEMWLHLAHAAQEALNIFMLRGPLSEEREIT